MLQSQAQGAISATEAIDTFLSSDDVRNVENTLNEFFYEWIRSETEYDRETRSTMLAHYQSLKSLLHQCQTIEAERRQPC